jgi:hypothetical protein
MTMGTGLALRSVTTPFRDALAALRWQIGGRRGPAPRWIKNDVLRRNGFPDGTWVETGTYLGQTSQFLSSFSSRVYTIEPAKALYERAKTRFARRKDVTVLHGTSEDVLPGLVPALQGPVNFWLDGHYSAGITFMGDVVSPIAAELATIEKDLARLGKVAVLVDDIRLFGTDPGYPALEVVIDWCNHVDLEWHIEHDILVMRSRSA